MILPSGAGAGRALRGWEPRYPGPPEPNAGGTCRPRQQFLPVDRHRVAPTTAADDPYLVGVPRAARSSRSNASNVGVSFLLTAAVVVPCALLAVSTPTPAPESTALAAAADGVAPGPAGAPTVTGPTAPACTPAPLEQRAAAVIVVGLPGVTSADAPLARAVIDLGVSGVFLSAGNVQSTSQVTALVEGLRAEAGRPLLISTDEESGRVSAARLIVGDGPSPRRLARRRTPVEVRQYAAEIGRDLASVGINLDLAPVIDLDGGPAGGIIGDRSFSSEPVTTEEYGRAFAQGLADAGVTPTLKHFPGQGRSSGDTHTGRSQVTADLGELQVTDLSPFQRLIDEGAPLVMMNHLDYAALDPELPASMSPAAYDLLRSMGFRGVAMTDSIGMGAVNLRWDFPEATVRAITAGADAVLATDGSQATRMRDAIVAAVASRRLSEERLDEAAARVTALAGGDPMALTCTAATKVEFSTP
jgi:beta-N-acetylhexosaminidase